LLLIFAGIVALGIKLVGTLLMGALTVIPASIAKNLARGMRPYVMLSAIFGGVISVAGVWLAETFRFLPGPAIVLLGVGTFAVTLLFARRGMA
jgi:ABC-type Mn2+/Zn2+ transport system permease subunit